MNVYIREYQRTVRIYFTRELRIENPITDKNLSPHSDSLYIFNQSGKSNQEKNALRSKNVQIRNRMVSITEQLNWFITKGYVCLATVAFRRNSEN